MSRDEARGALVRAGARLLEDSPRLLRAADRDARVEEETFLFYDGRLVVWTQRLAQPATRAAFAELRARYSRHFGEPYEIRDSDLVQSARWRHDAEKGRVLLSGYTGDRAGRGQLMVRVEDPSAVGGLIRQMRRDEVRGGDPAGADVAGPDSAGLDSAAPDSAAPDPAAPDSAGR
jgi:hypothetical protein